eukprot:COSAG02_NODE_59966_length_272_cov_1.202312_1_plen_47_part_10
MYRSSHFVSLRNRTHVQNRPIPALALPTGTCMNYPISARLRSDNPRP